LDDSATLNGTPKDDVILVPSSGVVHGAEGADEYLIDLHSTDFVVVTLDKGDDIGFVGKSFDWASSAPFWRNGRFAGGSPAGQYLGKSLSDWVASGVVPLDLDESESRFFPMLYDLLPYGDEVHGRAELFYGKISPATTNGASSYALSDWQSADGSFDDITDALVTWQTIGADGKVHDHHVVLAGAVDAVGYDLLRYAVGNAGVLSQGSDYVGGLIGWSDNPEADITTIHALGGDDTVAAYAGDVFADYAYRGWRDVIFGGSGNDSLDGGAGDDSLHGGVGQDTLIGGFGRDLLNGGGGLDTLIGGTGDDVYVVDGSDVIVEEASPNYRITINVDGVPVYESTDAKMFDLALWSSYSQSMGSMTSDERTWALGLPTTPTTEAAKAALENSSPHENGVSYRLSWRDVSSGFVHTDALRFQVTSEERGIDEVQGDLDLDLRDSRYANVEGATALGTTAHRLIGTEADNVLRSNGAGSTLEGLGGNDLYYVLAKGDRVLESADSGKDTIFSFTDIDRLADNVEDLYSKGSGLTLTGNALDNLIVGDDQANLLNGGQGADTLQGGSGDDSYVVSGQEDTIVETSGGGKDTVWVNRSFTLGAAATNDIEFMRAGSGSGVFMKGNQLSQYLVGATGEDTLDGGGGADSLYGGAGNDTYIVNSAADLIVEDADAGSDTIQVAYSNSGSTATMVAVGKGHLSNVENAVVTGSGLFNLQGDANDNRLTGNTANNRLDGGEGADTLTGGLGDDTYAVDTATDVVTELANEGTDTVQSSVTYTLANNVENLILTGTTAINGTGNALANVLTGNSAANTLDGGADSDTLVGGAGNDTYVVDSANDVVTETANEGTDTVQSSVTYILGNNVENLTLTGTTAINGMGNSLNNVLTGNTASNNLAAGVGNDTLDGGLGNDTLIGGVGNDTYVVDAATDVVTELANEGTDTVQSSVNYTLGNNVENLTLTGTTAINGTGNALNNVLIGNSAKNTLNGGAGNDTYVIDSTEDVVIESSGEGNADTVRVLFSGSYDLSSTNIENLVADGGAILATGNASNNHITGSTADDLLFGMAGNDTLVAGGGYDRLHGGDGQDTFEVDFSKTAGVEICGTERGGDTLVIKGVVSASDLVFNRVIAVNYAEDTYASFQRGAGTNLEIGLLREGNGQVIVVHEYFNADGTSSGSIGKIVVGGTTLSLSDVKNALAKPATSNGDLLYGFAVGETISGLDGNDTIDGDGGDDTLLGGAGADYITGSGLLNGGDDSDGLILREAVDIGKGSVMLGGSGDDRLNSADFSYMRRYNALLDGGVGNDVYKMDRKDTAVHRRGDGQDVVSSYTNASELRMEGLKLSDLLMAKTSWSQDLIIATKSGLHDDQVTVSGYFSKADTQRLKLSVLNETGAAYVEVTSATVNNLTKVGNDLNNVITGTAAGETLSGLGGNDTISGQGGNDTLLGGDGNDQLQGGDGNDLMQGGVGNDTFWDYVGTDVFEGGAGDDVFIGGGGGDTYIGGVGDDVFNHYLYNGAGNLTIVDSDSTAGNQDLLQMDANPYAVVFKQSGNDLLMTRMDAASSVTVKNWFSGSANQIENIQTSALQGNYIEHQGQLNTAGVQQLLQAMAGFTPGVGQSVITEQSNQALHVAIQRAWAVQTTVYYD
jgi:Ca2+-binding RTX toxin-like protein